MYCCTSRSNQLLRERPYLTNEQEEEARLIAEEEAKEEAARKAVEEEKARKRAKAKEKVCTISYDITRVLSTYTAVDSSIIGVFVIIVAASKDGVFRVC